MFEEKLKQFEKTLIKLAKSFSIPNMDWQDIAQELRVHLWLKFDKYNPKRDFNDWAYIVCRNKLKDLYKFSTRKKRFGKDISLENLQEKGLDIDNNGAIVVFNSRE